MNGRSRRVTLGRSRRKACGNWFACLGVVLFLYLSAFLCWDCPSVPARFVARVLTIGFGTLAVLCLCVLAELLEGRDSADNNENPSMNDGKELRP